MQNEADHIDKALQRCGTVPVSFFCSQARMKETDRHLYCSVLAQPSGAQPEVLVVDGQSQDATVALARAHGVKVREGC